MVTSEATSINIEAPFIMYPNDGLTLGVIVDDDGQYHNYNCSL